MFEYNVSNTEISCALVSEIYHIHSYPPLDEL